MADQHRVICLSKHKYGEADLILRLISSHGEVFSAIAKSALKSRRRFGGGVLEPTHHMNITLSRPFNSAGATERLPVLVEAQLIDDFSKLKTDYDRLNLALEFVRMVATVAREGDSHRELFNLLGHALKSAEVSDDPLLLKVQFQIKLLHMQGMLPPEEKFLPFTKTPIREHKLIGELLPHWRELTSEAQSYIDSYVQG